MNLRSCIPFILFFCLIAQFPASAAEISSQATSFSGENKNQLPTRFPDSLLILGRHQLSYSPAKAFETAKQILSISRESGNKPLEVAGLLLMAECQRHLLADYDKALELAISAQQLAEKEKLAELVIEALINQSQSYREQGNSFKSMEKLKKAEALSREGGDILKTIQCLNQLGQAHYSLGQQEEALNNHRMALDMSRQAKNKQQEAESIFLIGEVYREEAKPAAALEQHKKALALRQEIKDSLAMAESQLALGRTLKQSYDRQQEALSFFQQALQEFKNSNHLKGQARCLNEISLVLIVQQKYELAIEYAEAALMLSEQLNAKNQMRTSYEALYSSHAALKHYQEALQYKNLFVAISDLIYGEENERHLAQRLNRYEIAKKESEIAVLKKDNELRQLALEKKTTQRNYLLGSLGLLLIIVLLVAFLYRQKQSGNRQLQEINLKVQEQNRELQALNGTKDKFFSIISHDLKGPLNSLTSFSSLLINHTDALSRDEIRMLASDLDRSLKNLLDLLENLLEWARSQSGSILIQPETLSLNQLISNNVELLKPQAKNKQIALSLSLTENLHVYADRNLLNTILRNLISNAIKFTEADGEVQITASHSSSSEVQVSVKDNGIGISPAILEKLFKVEHKFSTPGTANEKGTGLGLLLCKEFIERSKGRLEIESEEEVGSCFRFTLPAGQTSATTTEDSAALARQDC